MKTGRLLWVAVLSSVALAWAVSAAAGDEPAQSASGRVGAHDPRFADKKLWPDVRGEEPYVTQEWEKVPLLVWAHPGTGAEDRRHRRRAEQRGRDPGLDREDPRHWLIDGEPAKELPGRDELVDLVLPASDKPYRLAAPPFRVRHLTIERGATMSARMKTPDTIEHLYGNVWICEGGRLDMFALHIHGDEHTFFRNDNRSEKMGSGRGSPTYICYWMTIQKTRGGSLEFLGDVRLGDELKFNDGTTIIGPRAKVMAGPPSIQIVGPEAILELQSGAWFGKHSPARAQNKDILVLGTLRAGSKNRPLTTDATLGLNPKKATDAANVDVAAALSNTKAYFRGVNRWGRNSLVEEMPGYSLAVGPNAAMRVHSSDPERFRLRLQWNGVSMRRRRRGEDESAERFEAGRALPSLVVAYFLSDDVVLDGVVFDHFHKGGIGVIDADLPEKWKHVSYGPSNAGKPEELIAVLDVPEAEASGRDTE